MPGLATNLVRECLRIRPDDNVTIFLYPHNIPLAEDISRECFRVGADVNLSLYTDRFYEDYMKLLPEDSLRRPSVYCRGLTELSTAEFWIGSAYDPAVYRRIPPGKMAATDEGETAAHLAPSRERKVRSLFVALGQVTRPRAKAYGLAYAAWERNVREASFVRADRLTADGGRLAKRLAPADRVHVTTDHGTDLELSVHGRRAFVYDGVVDDEDVAAGALNASIPAGNVAIAPIETSAEGTVVFDAPQAWAGRTIRQLRWQFSGGRVTTFDGDRNAIALRNAWEKATGDRDRIASVSIGLNPKARMGFLSDPIVRGAVSIAIGGNEDEGGTNKPGFFHAQTLADATVELDGTPIVRKGRLLAL